MKTEISVVPQSGQNICLNIIIVEVLSEMIDDGNGAPRTLALY
jgi:hypothetical protein